MQETNTPQIIQSPTAENPLAPITVKPIDIISLVSQDTFGRRISANLATELEERSSGKKGLLPLGTAVERRNNRSHRNFVQESLLASLQYTPQSELPATQAMSLVIEGAVRTGEQTMAVGIGHNKPKLDYVAVGILQSLAGTAINLNVATAEKADLWNTLKPMIKRLEIIGAKALFENWRKHPPVGKIRREDIPAADSSDEVVLQAFITHYRDSDHFPSYAFGQEIGLLTARERDNLNIAAFNDVARDANNTRAELAREQAAHTDTRSDLTRQLTDATTLHRSEVTAHASTRDVLTREKDAALAAAKQTHTTEVGTLKATHVQELAAAETKAAAHEARLVEAAMLVFDAAEFVKDEQLPTSGATIDESVRADETRFNTAKQLMNTLGIKSEELPGDKYDALQTRIAGLLRYMESTSGKPVDFSADPQSFALFQDAVRILRQKTLNETSAL